jgi:hypothetical protein
VKSKLDPELLRAYEETDYIVSDDPPLVLRVGEQNDDARILLASFGVSTAVFLTAWNPGSEKLSEDENLDRQMELLSEIEARRLNYLVGYGERDEWREYSYLILGIDRQDASDLALKFEQNAYVWLDDTGVPTLVKMS